MGRSYLFECSKCGYKARVSGSADEGRDFSVLTILCRDCHKLYDAVIRLKTSEAFKPRLSARARKSPADPPPAFEAVCNRLPVAGAKGCRWIQFKIRCPVSAVHKVQAWNEPGKCPRCGVYLERGALPFRIWD